MERLALSSAHMNGAELQSLPQPGPIRNTAPDEPRPQPKQPEISSDTTPSFGSIGIPASWSNPLSRDTVTATAWLVGCVTPLDLAETTATVGHTAAIVFVAVLSVASAIALWFTRRYFRLTAAREDAIMLMRCMFAASLAAIICTVTTAGIDALLPAVLLANTAVAGAVVTRLSIGAVIRFGGLKKALQRRVAVYGASQESREVFATLAGASGDVAFVGLFDDRADPKRQDLYGIEVCGSFADLETLIRNGQIDDVIIALPPTATERIAMFRRKLEIFAIDVYVGVEIAEPDWIANDVRFDVNTIGSVQLARVHSKPIRSWGLALKALEDRIIGLAMLVTLLPIFAGVAIAIKLDSRGPVFFRQRRHGISGEEIIVWKFRTMRVMENSGEIQQARKDDDRITRVGRLLRKTSLDELPQLINVLQGNMSLVGPRPHAIAHNEFYGQRIREYAKRNQVKPGITGWAQINGYRGETRDEHLMEKRVEYDIWYIRHWTIWLDLKIILLTPIYGLVHKNAY